MKGEPIVLHLDRSTMGQPRFERDGARVDLEAVFSEGFKVEPNDCPALLTLIAQFLEARDQTQK